MPPSPDNFFFVFFIVTLSCVCEVKSGSRADLRARLLKDYDRTMFPPNSNDSIMNFFVDISTIIEVVEKQGYIALGVGFANIWFDSRIRWNRSIDKVHRLSFKKDTLWMPNPTFLYNRVENDARVIEEPLFATPNGYVIWYKYTLLRSVCNFDLTQFPFDQQECHIIFGSRFNEYKAPREGNYPSLYQMKMTSRWKVLEVQAIDRKQNHFDEEIKLVDIAIKIERRTSLVSTSIICPLLFNVLVSLLPFWTTSSTRLALGGASLLLGTAIFWKLNELLPLDGYTKPFLAHYCILALTVSLLSLVYGVLRCALTKRAPVACLMSFASKVTRPLPALFCLPSPTAAKDTPTEERGLASFPNLESGAISWSDTLTVIDKLTFAVCSVVYFLATVILLATLSATS